MSNIDDRNANLANFSPSDTIKLISPNNQVHSLIGEDIDIENLSDFKISSKEDASAFDTELILFVGIYEMRINLAKIKVDAFRLEPNYDELSDKAFNFRRLLSTIIYQYSITDAIPLGTLYELYPHFVDFQIFLDLKINFANCSARAFEMIALHYNNYALNERNPKMVFLSDRLQMQYVAQSLVINIRSLWDKIMGMIIFLDYGPEERKKFLNSKSRKKFFSRKYESNPDFNEVLEVINLLDNEFRTQEIHHTGGKIRNNALSNGLLSNNYLLKIIGHYNYVHEFLDNNYNWIISPKVNKEVDEEV